MAEFDLSIIREFRKRPELYDQSAPYFRDKEHNALAWQEISDINGYEVRIIKDRMLQLRNRYNLEKRRIESLNNADPSQQHSSQWPLYEHLSFLHDHIRSRRSFKNMVPLAHSASETSNVSRGFVKEPTPNTTAQSHGPQHNEEAEADDGKLVVKDEPIYPDSDTPLASNEEEDEGDEEQPLPPAPVVTMYTPPGSKLSAAELQHKQQNLLNYINLASTSAANRAASHSSSDHQQQQQQATTTTASAPATAAATASRNLISIRSLDSMRNSPARTAMHQHNSVQNNKYTNNITHNNSLPNVPRSTPAAAAQAYSSGHNTRTRVREVYNNVPIRSTARTDPHILIPEHQRPPQKKYQGIFEAFGQFVGNSLQNMQSEKAYKLMREFTSDLTRAMEQTGRPTNNSQHTAYETATASEMRRLTAENAVVGGAADADDGGNPAADVPNGFCPPLANSSVIVPNGN